MKRPLLLTLPVLLLTVALSEAAPPNDNLTDRLALLGPNVSVTSSNIDATKETGETNHASGSGYTASGKSVWYSWTPASTGYAEFTLAGAFNKVLAIYTGPALTNLTRKVLGYDNSSYNAYARFDATAGTEYLLAVDGYSTASGNFTLSLVQTPPPPNDHFADRIILTGANITTNGANKGATKEPGEPNHAGYTGGHSVWWTWTAPVGGRVAISVGGSFRKAIAIYTGTELASLTPVANAADFDSGSAAARFDAVAGVAYQIAVEGAQSTDFTTNLTVTVAVQPPPANDNFANAATLTGTNFFLNSATNISATLEAGEPSHAGRVGGRSVWWNWTAPVSGHFVVLATGYFNKLLGVYTGDSVSVLTEVGRGYGTTNNPAQAGFDATAGTTYRLAVDGENGAFGNFSLEFRLPPLNDDFANRFTLTGTTISVTATNTLATKEPGELDHAGNSGGKSLWWTWTAPLAGRVMVTVTTTGLDPLVAVYSGTDFASLTTNASGSANSPGPAYASFDAVPGATYQIAMDGKYGDSGSLTLKLTYVTAPPNDFFADAMWVTNSPPPTGPVTNPVPADFFVLSSNLGATREAGESGSGNASVWWRWTAPTNGEVLIELETYLSGSTMTFPWLTFYRGTTVSNLTEVPYIVRFAGQMRYYDARYRVTAGTTYYIRAANSDVQGPYTLRGKFEGVPLNDNFTNRIRIENTSFLLQYGYVYQYGWNSAATLETGEPWHGGASYPYGSKSVWWTWTAPASGRASFGALPQRYVFTSMVGVYTGTVLNNLTRIANAYSTCTAGSSAVSFNVTAGTTYQLAIDGSGSYGEGGEYELSLSAEFDTNAPSVTITNPLPGHATNAALIVRGTASDLPGTGAYDLASGVNLVEVRLNGGAWLPATGTNAWSRALTLANGVNLIEARARDVIGNYSSLASVTATYGVLLSPMRLSGGMPQLTFATESGKTYQLEWVDSLPPLHWQPVDGATVSGTGVPATCTDTNCAGQPQRFYRLSIY